MLRSVTLGLAISVLIAACALVEQPAAVQPSRSFVQVLDSHGQRFVPLPVPETGIVSPDIVLQTLRRDGFPPFATDRTADQPIYGVVQCRSANCDPLGLVEEQDENVPIWLVGFPRASGGNGGQAWAVVDARTGGFLVGDGPPGP